MGESSQQLIRKLNEERLENLKKDYADVFAQLNRTENAQSRNNLERQLEDIEQGMNKVERKLKSILQTEVTPHPLLQLLTPYFDSAITPIQRAYQASCPQGFSQQADTIKDILEILQDLKNNTQFSPIAHFVAHLVIDSNIPQTLRKKLQIWAKNNIKNFKQLVKNIQINENKDNEDTNSYLLIRVKPKAEKKLDKFYISAWLIPNIQHYNPKMGDGYRQLTVSKSLRKTFTLEDIPKVVDSLLEQSSYDFIGKLTVEFFLPYKLLNHAVDTFSRVEFDAPESIGKKYRVVVRANERLQKNYPYKGVWLDKWQKMKRICNSHCRQGLVSRNHSQAALRKELDKAIGIILTKIPKNTSNEIIFSFILMTATPIALWVRKEIKVQTVVRNAFLDCCIFELPDKVKEKRLDAPEDEDDHVGNNLSLLWEDPERLTPDADYCYSTPQSVP